MRENLTTKKIERLCGPSIQNKITSYLNLHLLPFKWCKAASCRANIAFDNLSVVEEIISKDISDWPASTKNMIHECFLYNCHSVIKSGDIIDVWIKAIKNGLINHTENAPSPEVFCDFIQWHWVSVSHYKNLDEIIRVWIENEPLDKNKIHRYAQLVLDRMLFYGYENINDKKDENGKEQITDEIWRCLKIKYINEFDPDYKSDKTKNAYDYNDNSEIYYDKTFLGHCFWGAPVDFCIKMAKKSKIKNSDHLYYLTIGTCFSRNKATNTSSFELLDIMSKKYGKENMIREILMHLDRATGYDIDTSSVKKAIFDMKKDKDGGNLHTIAMWIENENIKNERDEIKEKICENNNKSEHKAKKTLKRKM